MTSQLSYFHLGQVTIDDVRPYMENTYTIMEVCLTKFSCYFILIIGIFNFRNFGQRLVFKMLSSARRQLVS